MELSLILFLLCAAAAQEASNEEVGSPAATPVVTSSPHVLRSLQRSVTSQARVDTLESNALNDLEVAIIKNIQHMPDASGAYSFDFEAENGIKFQFSGSEGENGGANMVGVYSYPMEDGQIAEVSFVADENGYQPDSALLPVAPAFPHPIPQFVLEQIEFARLEDERKVQERHEST